MCCRTNLWFRTMPSNSFNSWNLFRQKNQTWKKKSGIKHDAKRTRMILTDWNGAATMNIHRGGFLDSKKRRAKPKSLTQLDRLCCVVGCQHCRVCCTLFSLVQCNSSFHQSPLLSLCTPLTGFKFPAHFFHPARPVCCCVLHSHWKL